MMADQETDEEEARLAIELIEGGSEIAGASVGAAVGLIGGPPGIVAGATAGVLVTKAFKRVGSDLHRRFLAPSEEVRVGGAAAIAASVIAATIEAGEMQPRDDGFFEEGENGSRSTADEVLEGVLLKARGSYEEKKIPYLGRLYASIAFFDEISPGMANHLVELASQLTYRQFVLLAIFGSANEGMRDGGYRNDQDAFGALGIEGRGLLTEAYELYQRGLLSGGGSAWIALVDVNPRKARPIGSGQLLFRMMELGKIPDQDRRDIVRVLGTPPN